MFILDLLLGSIFIIILHFAFTLYLYNREAVGNRLDLPLLDDFLKITITFLKLKGFYHFKCLLQIPLLHSLIEIVLFYF